MAMKKPREPPRGLNQTPHTNFGPFESGHQSLNLLFKQGSCRLGSAFLEQNFPSNHILIQHRCALNIFKDKVDPIFKVHQYHGVPVNLAG